MIYNRKDGKSTARRALTLLLLVGGSMVTLVQAQEVRRIKTGQTPVPEIMIVRGLGEKAPAKPAQRVVRRPAPLSPVLKQYLLKAAGIILNNVALSFTLTPAAPVSADKGSLKFSNVSLVDPSEPPPFDPEF